jgi:hypothetical protein
MGNKTPNKNRRLLAACFQNFSCFFVAVKKILSQTVRTVQCNDIFNTTMEYGGYGKR